MVLSVDARSRRAWSGLQQRSYQKRKQRDGFAEHLSAQFVRPAFPISTDCASVGNTDRT